jgi:two-component system sensor histidine kinase BaeS
VARIAADLPNDLDQRAPIDEGPAEVRAVAVALNGTAERLSEILRRTQRVAADASHHLRTPLTGVRLRLEAIEDVTDQPEVADEARAATVEVDRLTHRIEQVLELAKGDAGSLPLEEQDLGAIARQRAEAAAPVFGERGVMIEVDAVDEALVLAPRGSMARIVDELLGNALQYAREHVVVGVEVSTQTVVLTVADDGPGVPEGEREAVFERFRRGSAAAPGGTGLGLALVRETVTSAGGSVRVQDSPVGGASISVRIPRVGA